METVWTFGNGTGTVTTGLWLNPTTSAREIYHRQYDSRGEVKQVLTVAAEAAANPLLKSIPPIWKGLEQADSGDLYLAGTTAVDPVNGRYLSQAARGDSNPYRFDGNTFTGTKAVTKEVSTLDTYSTIALSLADVGSAGWFTYLAAGRSGYEELANTSLYAPIQIAGTIGLTVASFGTYGVLAAGNQSVTLTRIAGVVKAGSLLERSALAIAGIDAIDAVAAFGQSSSNLYNGTFNAFDTLGFLPAVGFATGWLRRNRAAELFDTYRGRDARVSNSRINVRTGESSVVGSGFEYAVKNHGGYGAASKSQFTISNDEIRKLLQRRDVIDAGLRRSGTSGNYIREVDVGRFIGRLPANKGARRTTVITVITDVKGNLVNTFPGTLGRRATLR